MGRRRPRKRPVRAAEAAAPTREAVDDESFDDIRQIVTDALADTLDLPDDSMGVWVQDIADTWVVYQVGDGDLFRLGYTMADDRTVTFNDDPVEVDRKTTYEPAAPDADDTPSKVAESLTRTVEAVDRIPGRVLEARGADDAGGRIFRVQIIAYGESKNGRRYPESVMRGAARMYEGAKAFDHHRTDEELRTSTIQGMVGQFRNVEATGGGLEADLHLLPSATHTAEAMDATLRAQEANLPPLIGISHDVMARYSQVVNGGRRFMEATEICSVNSADVVADPAAGGRVTRMVAGGTGDTTLSEEDDDMTLTELRALLKGASPEKRAELLTEHAAVLEAAGITTDDINLLEPVTPAAEPTKELVGAGVGAAGGTTAATESARRGGTRSTEAAAIAFGRGSALGRTLIRSAVSDAHLDERLVESVTRQLPEQFTEADLANVVDTATNFTREFEAAGLAPTVPDVKVTQDALDGKAKRLDAMFAGDYAGGGYRSFKEAYIDITGNNPRLGDVISEDFNRTILRESIGAQPYDGASRGLESASSTTWNTILGDSITRRMVAEYSQPNLQTWRNIVSATPPINDFRTQRIERFGGYGVLPAVNEGAPYQPLTTPGNEEATYSITKRGGTEDLTLETIANDDLRLVQRIPRALGLAAAQTLYRFVWDLLDTNVTCTFDSTALFAAGHGSNTATNSLSQANLSAGRKTMRKQTAYGDTSDILSITPKYLILSADIEELGWELATSPVALGANVGTATGANISNVPNIHQGLTPIVIDYWSSTTKWILVADPNMVPTIEVGFYQGRETPELFSQTDPTVGAPFNADKVVWKIRHIYSGTVLDFRGFYRGNV